MVTDKDGAAIPDAEIRVNPKGTPEGVKHVNSDKNGRFDIPSVADGEYEIRVKYSGFSDAWQPFKVSGFNTNQNCTKPLRVVMVPAGGCSYVDNASKKSALKK